MIVLRKDHGRIGVGVTAPRLMEGADGKLYVVKLAANRVGKKVLANEWLGYRLGEKLRLPIPRGAMVRFAPRLLEASPALGKLSAADEVHFATRYLADCEYVGRRTIMCAVNKDEVVGAMLFDHFLYNEDRTLNRKNLLARRERCGIRIYVIDHSHLLGSGRWTAETLLMRAEKVTVDRRLAYGWLLRHYVTGERLMPHLQRILSIKAAEVEDILHEIPTAWLGDADKEAVLCFWQMRSSKAEEIAETIVASASYQHRRTERYKIK